MTDTMSHPAATAEQERTVFFEAEGHQLFGIITEAIEPNGYGVVIIQGGDTVNVSLLRNRMSVTMARLLAGAGYHVLRFDYHGLGESNGDLGELNLADPFSGDAVEAVACLRRETDSPQVFLVGACFSARTALSAAPAIDNLAGLVLPTPPSASFARSDGSAQRMARDRHMGEFVTRAARLKTLRGLGDPETRAVYRRLLRAKLRQVFRTAGSGDRLHWVSDQFLEPLQEMVARRVPVWIAFGVDDAELREFERAESGRLGSILGESEGVIEVTRDLPGIIHGFGTVSGQRLFTERTLDWVSGKTTPRP